MVGNVFDAMKEKSEELFSHHMIHESVPFGVLLAIVGGFLDAYTFMSRGGVFANAQTGNIVLLGVYASKREWRQALIHVPPILAFIVGVIVTEWIRNNQSRLFLKDWPQTVLILEIIILFIIGFIPDTISSIVVTAIVSFVASIQSSSFRKLVDSPYATTMSMGNLRTASQAAYIAFTKKDRASAIRAVRFFMVILSFIFGAFLGGLSTLAMGVKAIWIAAVVLVCSAVLFSLGKGKNKYESA